MPGKRSRKEFECSRKDQYAGLFSLELQMSKYTPTHYAPVVVETYQRIPDDPQELQKLKDKLSAKYQAQVSIDKHEYVKQEWSWRTDSSYDVHVTEYRVTCMQPFYSREDNRAMLQDEMRAFNEKYKDAFKKR